MRQTVELIVVLCLCVLLVRTFSAEAYVVPTGSMAPTLLGLHREIRCPSCNSVFVVGIEDEGQTGEAICPNCGKRGLDDGPSIECGGDRVLVEKFLYEFRRPRRWEVAVFHFPGEPSQAYVKRVVGLPGESIRINGGDIFVNDRIVRKSLAGNPGDAHAGPRQPIPTARRRTISALAVSVRTRQTAVPRAVGSATAADLCMTPATRRPRSRTTGWSTSTGTPAGAATAPMTDFHGYNGNEPRELQRRQRHRHGSTIDPEPVDRVDLGRAAVGLRSIRRARFRPRTAGTIELLRNGQPVTIANRSNPFMEKGLWPRTVRARSRGHGSAASRSRSMAGCCSSRSITTIRLRPGTRAASLLELGVRGGAVEVSEIRDLSRHLLHEHAGEHAAAVARDAVRREARRRRVLRAGRQ